MASTAAWRAPDAPRDALAPLNYKWGDFLDPDKCCFERRTFTNKDGSTAAGYFDQITGAYCGRTTWTNKDGVTQPSNPNQQWWWNHVVKGDWVHQLGAPNGGVTIGQKRAAPALSISAQQPQHRPALAVMQASPSTGTGGDGLTQYIQDLLKRVTQLENENTAMQQRLRELSRICMPDSQPQQQPQQQQQYQQQQPQMEPAKYLSGGPPPLPAIACNTQQPYSAPHGYSAASTFVPVQRDETTGRPLQGW